jgi:type I restriction enzyme S subunit
MANLSALKRFNLDEVFWFQEGPGVRKWQFTDSGIKLLNVANIEKNRTINLGKTDRHLDFKEVEDRYSHFLLDAGDLVIASSGISFDDDGMLRTRGAFVEERHLPLCLNTSTIRFKSKPEISDLGYLQHWLDSREFREQITKRVTGSAQQNFGPSHLKEIKITLPPIPEQRRIAAILDQADALRAKRREALAQLDSLTQSIFVDMFGDAQTIFNKWPTKKLGEILDFLTSGSRGWAEYYSDCGALFLRIQNVCRDELRLEDVAFVNAPNSAEAKRTKVQEGDVLLSITADLGRTAVIPAGLGDAHINQHLSILRTSKVMPRYLSAFLTSPAGQREIHGRDKHGVKAGLNFDDIRSFRLPIPPEPLQCEFVQRTNFVTTQKIRYQQSLAELEGLFASLQHRAFRGEL